MTVFLRCLDALIIPRFGAWVWQSLGPQKGGGHRCSALESRMRHRWGSDEAGLTRTVIR